MIRAPMGTVAYWDSRVEFDLKVAAENRELLKLPSKNP